jgi:hypothetical protein
VVHGTSMTGSYTHTHEDRILRQANVHGYKQAGDVASNPEKKMDSWE